MNKDTAAILLRNLVERANESADKIFLTRREIEALDTLLDVDQQADMNSRPAANYISPENFGAEPEAVIDVLKFSNLVADDEILVCVDFGTSFSKAFASRDAAGMPELIDLPLGADKTGRPQLATPSELFINDGRIYFGQHARIQFDDTQAAPDRLIDSIKQYMTLGSDVAALSKIKVDPAQDPTQTLFQRDLLSLYLGHLMVLTEAALTSKGLSINVARRFTHPAWKDANRESNENEMRIMMAEAIALARSLGDRLVKSISVAEARAALDELRSLDSGNLPMNLIRDPVREATAAGAGALLSSPPRTREVFLIVDVGAGTTDVAGCLCVNNPDRETARVFEVSAAADAIRSAGNVLDSALAKLVLQKCGLIEGSEEYRAAAMSMRRDKRIHKEQLFNNGSVAIQLPTEVIVEVSIEEFQKFLPVVEFGNKIREMVARAADAVAGDAARINLVATGGGSRLPIIQEIVSGGVQAGTRHLSFVHRDAMPAEVAQMYPDLVDPYPQIAVAVGGSLPTLPEQMKNIPSGFSAAPRRQISPVYKS